MVVVEWKVRDYEDPIDEQEAYGNFDGNLFSLKIHHGGFFTEPPGRCYTNGTFNYVDFVDSDLFSVMELQEMLKTLGYPMKKNKMYYHFKIPNSNLDYGLQAFGNDADVINLVRYIDKYRLIEVYIEHEYTVLDTYLKSSQKLRLEEIVDVESSALARKLCKQNAEFNECNEEDHNEDENGSDCNEEAAYEDETVSESDESDDSEDSDYIVDDDNVGPSKSKGKVEVPAKMNVEEGYDLDDFDMDIDSISLVRSLAVASRRQLYVWKNDKVRVRAVCRGKCLEFTNGLDASGLNSPNRGKIKQVNGKWIKRQKVQTSCSGQGINNVGVKQIKVEATAEDSNQVGIALAVEKGKGLHHIHECKGGFKEGLRELLGLDGCFMKGQYPGQLLTAVGIDANHGAAIAQVFPNAEHRLCVRHIYENFKAQWKGNQFKELVWKCAAATTIQYFDKKMEKLKNLDEATYEYLQKIPLQHWSRSHFSGRAHCELVFFAKLSCVKSFNGQLGRWQRCSKNHIGCQFNFGNGQTNADVGGVDLSQAWLLHIGVMTGQKPIQSYNQPSPMIGRLPKSRKKSAGEISTQKISKNGKLSRFGKSVTCGKCGNKGHNKTTCKAKVMGSQASNVGGSQGSNVRGSQGSKVEGS
ncbi:hypothetical protein Tco_0849480 [Tanacetum coccineum]